MIFGIIWGKDKEALNQPPPLQCIFCFLSERASISEIPLAAFQQTDVSLYRLKTSTDVIM